MWIATGMPDGRLAVIIKLHHVIADGLAALQLLASLVNDALPLSEQATTPPPWRQLVHDNLRTRLGGLRRMHPSRLVNAFRGTRKMLSESWNAPRTSLNAQVGPNRSLAVLRLDLAEDGFAARQR